jgi:hypothetical protein
MQEQVGLGSRGRQQRREGYRDEVLSVRQITEERTEDSPRPRVRMKM